MAYEESEAASFGERLQSGMKKLAKKESDKSGSRLAQIPDFGPSPYSSYKKGGRVRRTGLAKVHKGERVLTRKQARKYERKRGRR